MIAEQKKGAAPGEECDPMTDEPSETLLQPADDVNRLCRPVSVADIAKGVLLGLKEVE